MSAPVLQIKQLHQRFGKTEVLRGVNLSLAAGERVALIGPNGAGKSTLFDLISGRLAPSSGQIYLHGQRIDGLPAQRIHRLGLARSFQTSQLFGQLSVLDNLRCAALWSLGYGYSFWRRLHRLRDVNARAQALLVQLGLSDKQALPAQQLSYAEQRALELGLTLASGAPLLLLDEPTAGMSRSETERFIALIRLLSQGKTLLTVEHDMSVVFALADKVAVLLDGAIIAFDTPENVRANALVQQAYLGCDIGSGAAGQEPGAC